jgi:hypothetical protein
MASPAVATAIQDYLAANFTAAHLSLENDGYKPTNEPWVYAEIIGTAWDQASIGAGSALENSWEEMGLAMFHVYVPSGTGDAKVRALCYGLLDLFRGVTLLNESIRFYRASCGGSSPGSLDGKWWRMTASVEWERLA